MNNTEEEFNLALTSALEFFPGIYNSEKGANWLCKKLIVVDQQQDARPDRYSRFLD